MGAAKRLEGAVSNDRLRQLLGPASALLHPLYGLLLLLFACLPLLAIASQPLGIVLAAFSTYLLLMAVRLEQPWLQLTPLPPLTVVCLGAWIHSGIGGGIIAISTPSPGSAVAMGMWKHLPEAQLLWIIFCALNVLTFLLRPPANAPAPRSEQQINSKALIRLTIACSIVALGSIAIGFISGTLDRNPSSYLYWVSQRWRPDSVLTMFARFRDVYFFLAPLAIFKARSNWRKALLLAIFLAYIAMALPLGGRGLLLWPFVYSCMGLWLTPIAPKNLRTALLATAACCIFMLPLIQAYKVQLISADHDRTSIPGRLEALQKAASNLNPFSSGTTSQLYPLGSSMYGCIDALLFQPPASTRPRAGFHRMENILTAWIPELLVHKSSPLRDAHLIAAEASGLTRQEAESKTYTSHDCVTFGADLYWRGSWTAVALGSAAAAIFYRLISELWYRHCGWQSVQQILLLVYPATFITVYPFGSVGETAWLWMWDLPKYIILISLICLIADRLANNQQHTGK